MDQDDAPPPMSGSLTWDPYHGMGRWVVWRDVLGHVNHARATQYLPADRERVLSGIAEAVCRRLEGRADEPQAWDAVLAALREARRNLPVGDPN